MKKSIALIFVAGTFILAGCSTMQHVTKWEYKVADLPHQPSTASLQEWRDQEQGFLNNLGKDGWVLIHEDDGRVFYFKRPIK